MIETIYSRYSDYVFGPLYSQDSDDPRDQFAPHSGVYSPAITCDPQYNVLPIKVLYALKSLGSQLDHHPVARRALEWYAYGDGHFVPQYLRDEAKDWLEKPQ